MYISVSVYFFNYGDCYLKKEDTDIFGFDILQRGVTIFLS